MNNKQCAASAALTLTHGLVQQGVPADDIADALIVRALAVWAADTGRQSDAKALLTIWAQERDRV